MDKMTMEIKMVLLEDLREALQGVLKNVLPSLEAEAGIVTHPELGVFIRVGGERPLYPQFVAAAAVVRPTREHRKQLGLHTLG